MRKKKNGEEDSLDQKNHSPPLIDFNNLPPKEDVNFWMSAALMKHQQFQLVKSELVAEAEKRKRAEETRDYLRAAREREQAKYTKELKAIKARHVAEIEECLETIKTLEQEVEAHRELLDEKSVLLKNMKVLIQKSKDQIANLQTTINILQERIEESEVNTISDVEEWDFSVASRLSDSEEESKNHQ